MRSRNKKRKIEVYHGREKQGNLMKSFIDYFYGNFVYCSWIYLFAAGHEILDTDEYGRLPYLLRQSCYLYFAIWAGSAYIRYFYKAVKQTKIFCSV